MRNNRTNSSSWTAVLSALWPLFVVQFFTWLALFALWIYVTPFLAQNFFRSGDTEADFENAIVWAGYTFAFYVSLAAVLSFFITKLVKKIGAAQLHAICLLIGGCGLGALFVVREKLLLFAPFLLIAVAWSSISNVPYVLVERAAEKNSDDEDDEANDARIDLYFKIFNLSVVIPQISAAFFWNYVNKMFDNNASYVLLSGAFSLFIAAFVMLIFANRFQIKKEL